MEDMVSYFIYIVQTSVPDILRGILAYNKYSLIYLFQIFFKLEKMFHKHTVLIRHRGIE